MKNLFENKRKKKKNENGHFDEIKIWFLTCIHLTYCHCLYFGLFNCLIWLFDKLWLYINNLICNI